MLKNVLLKAGKGIAHGVIGAVAFGLYTAANLWHPDTTSPAALLLWQSFGISMGVGLSQAIGRVIGYDPAKDPTNPAFHGERP